MATDKFEIDIPADGQVTLTLPLLLRGKRAKFYIEETEKKTVEKPDLSWLIGALKGHEIDMDKFRHEEEIDEWRAV